MSPELEQLIELQNLESALEESRRRIAAHPQRIADAEARLAHARDGVEAAKQRFKASQDSSGKRERRRGEPCVKVYGTLGERSSFGLPPLSYQ